MVIFSGIYCFMYVIPIVGTKYSKYRYWWSTLARTYRSFISLICDKLIQIFHMQISCICRVDLYILSYLQMRLWSSVLNTRDGRAIDNVMKGQQSWYCHARTLKGRVSLPYLSVLIYECQFTLVWCLLESCASLVMTKSAATCCSLNHVLVWCLPELLIEPLAIDIKLAIDLSTTTTMFLLEPYL